ncbi:MAG: Nif3-like dinuclear metal center hexameric protein [Saprospiraceae bacterium]
MKLSGLLEFLQDLAPFEYQETYDNSGHLVGNPQDEIEGVVVSLDATEDVIDEAIALGANVVLSHHPIIFGGIKRLTGNNYVQRTVQKALLNNINLVAIHTNLDNVYNHGVSTYLAELLGLENTDILSPKPGLEYKKKAIGSGAIGTLSREMDEKAFLGALKSTLDLKTLKHTNLLNKPIKKVALCGGSGRFLLEEAKARNADVFISSDFKYHEFFDAENQIVIADIGHYESEKHTIRMLHEILTNKFSNFASHYTKVNTNPVNYL